MNHTDGIDERLQNILPMWLAEEVLEKDGDVLISLIKNAFLKDLQELMGQKQVYGTLKHGQLFEFIPLSAVEALIEKYRSEK